MALGRGGVSTLAEVLRESVEVISAIEGGILSSYGGVAAGGGLVGGGVVLARVAACSQFHLCRLLGSGGQRIWVNLTIEL